MKRLTRRLRRILLALALAAPQCAAYAQSVPSAAPPVGGGATWSDAKGNLDSGLALPLATWASIFPHTGNGQLILLVGKSSSGAALAHEFWRVEPGNLRASLSIGVGFVLPYTGKTAKSGKPVVLLVVGVGPAGAKP